MPARVALGQIIQGHPGVLGPAVHRQPPLALCVLARPAHGDALGAEFLQPADHFIGATHRQRADHHAAGAGIEDARHIVAAAHATAGLHLQRRLRADRCQQRRQRVATGTRGVQIDQMHPLRLRGEGLRARHGSSPYEVSCA
jgi:hypothetical protein